MVKKCQVKCCGKSDASARLRRFPKTERCLMWLEFCQNDELKDLTFEQLNQLCTVCDEHFDDVCYMNETRHRLVHDAVPTICLRRSSNTICPFHPARHFESSRIDDVARSEHDVDESKVNKVKLSQSTVEETSEDDGKKEKDNNVDEASRDCNLAPGNGCTFRAKDPDLAEAHGSGIRCARALVKSWKEEPKYKNDRKNCVVVCCSSKPVDEPILHRFPIQENRSHQWTAFCKNPLLVGRTVKSLHQRTRMCSEHFRDSCFMNTLRQRLIHDAVPTLCNATKKPCPFHLTTVTRKLSPAIIVDGAKVGRAASPSLLRSVAAQAQPAATSRSLLKPLSLLKSREKVVLDRPFEESLEQSNILSASDDEGHDASDAEITGAPDTKRRRRNSQFAYSVVTFAEKRVAVSQRKLAVQLTPAVVDTEHSRDKTTSLRSQKNSQSSSEVLQAMKGILNDAMWLAASVNDTEFMQTPFIRRVAERLAQVPQGQASYCRKLMWDALCYADAGLLGQWSKIVHEPDSNNAIDPKDSVDLGGCDLGSLLTNDCHDHNYSAC